ncbi:hypothetical protein OH77DRAFT_493273 [Trametes cingulata]|nr:hypothetical protein OH77DRAFT_493273 [Trametes cingulata]
MRHKRSSPLCKHASAGTKHQLHLFILPSAQHLPSAAWCPPNPETARLHASTCPTIPGTLLMTGPLLRAVSPSEQDRRTPGTTYSARRRPESGEPTIRTQLVCCTSLGRAISAVSGEAARILQTACGTPHRARGGSSSEVWGWRPDSSAHRVWYGAGCERTPIVTHAHERLSTRAGRLTIQ